MPNTPPPGPGRRRVLAGLIAAAVPGVPVPGAGAQSARPLAVPLAFRATTGVASAPITVGHFFAEGDIPAGARVALAGGLADALAPRLECALGPLVRDACPLRGAWRIASGEAPPEAG